MCLPPTLQVKQSTLFTGDKAKMHPFPSERSCLHCVIGKQTLCTISSNCVAALLCWRLSEHSEHMVSPLCWVSAQLTYRMRPSALESPAISFACHHSQGHCCLSHTFSLRDRESAHGGILTSTGEHLRLTLLAPHPSPWVQTPTNPLTCLMPLAHGLEIWPHPSPYPLSPRSY